MKTYFITDGTAIKIGRSRNGGESRVKENTMNPRGLELIGEIDGDYESEFHNKYSQYNIRGEWFRPTTELLTEICGRCQISAADFPEIQEVREPILSPTPTLPRAKHPCLVECDHVFFPNEHLCGLEHEFFEWWCEHFITTQEYVTHCLTDALNEKMQHGATEKEAFELLEEEGFELCAGEECSHCLFENIGIWLGDSYILERIDAIGINGLAYVIVYLGSEFATYKDSRLHKKLANIAWELDGENVLLQLNYVDVTNNRVVERFLPHRLVL